MSDLSLVQEWFRYSQNDLISARHLFENVYPKQIEIACYLSQQCAEKSLKGFLIFKDIDPPRTHDLVKLCQLCINYDSTFSKISNICSDLTPYGVGVRYPNQLTVDDVLTKSAISKAQLIYDFCVGKIPESSKG